MKLFNISFQVWIVMGVSIVIAFVYALINDFTSNNKGTELNKKKYIAVLLCCLMAVISTVVSKNITYISAPMMGLIMSILLVNIAPVTTFDSDFKSGTTFAGKKYLNIGIVFLGATLSFLDLFKAIYALPLIIFNILLSFLVSYFVGKKLFNVSENTCTLVGSGTCICGGTAIATISPIIKAKEEETAFAMTSIFLFDLLACLSYPYLAIFLGLNHTQFGFLAGTAINDTSSVVAAQELYASLNGISNYALPATIKVVRTTMIIVLALVFSLVTARKESSTTKENANNKTSLLSMVWKSLPKFVLLFLLVIALNTLLISCYSKAEWYVKVFKVFFSNSYKFFVTIALCGVGFKIRFKELLTKGLKPICLGGVTWAAVFISSLLFSLFLAERFM